MATLTNTSTLAQTPNTGLSALCCPPGASQHQVLRVVCGRGGGVQEVSSVLAFEQSVIQPGKHNDSPW